MIKFDCPECGFPIVVFSRTTGKVHICMSCGTTLEIPDDLKDQRLPWWVVARRCIGAFFAYLVYWGTVFGAIRMGLLYTLWQTEAIEALRRKKGTFYFFREFGEHHTDFGFPISG